MGHVVLAYIKPNILFTQKTVVIVSIMMQSTNQKCNALQSLIGIFLHSEDTSERVIKAFTHFGISIGPSSIHRGINSLSARTEDGIQELARTLLASWAFDNFDINFPTSTPTVEGIFDTLEHLTSGLLFRLAHGVQLQHLRCSAELWQHSKFNPNAKLVDGVKTITNIIDRLSELHPDEDEEERTGLSRSGRFNAWMFRRDLVREVPGFGHFRDRLGEPEEIEVIPPTKLEYIPARAMDLNQSTVAGNKDAIRNLFGQGGIGDPSDDTDWHNITPDDPVDMTDYVSIIHGDLGAWARLNSLRERRGLEDTPWRRFQFIVFVPGLFHLKMAGADAIWKILIRPKEAEKDANSLRTLAGQLRPKETGKLATKPGFRRIHEVIQHAGIVLRLNAWKIKLRQRNPEWGSIEAFVASKPSWELIEEISCECARDFVAGEDLDSDLFEIRSRPKEERDQEHENIILIHKYLLMYEELSFAMNTGDIGRLECLLPSWIYFFRGSSKPNYANAMLQYLNDVLFVYPEGLR